MLKNSLDIKDMPGIVALLLLTACVLWYDVRTKTVPLWTPIAFLLVSAWHVYIGNHFLMMVPSFLFMLAVSLGSFAFYYSHHRHNGMGLVDVAFLSLSGWWLPMETLPIYLIFVGFLSFLTGLWWRKVYIEITFPFTPAILMALLLCFWIGEK